MRTSVCASANSNSSSNSSSGPSSTSNSNNNRNAPYPVSVFSVGVDPERERYTRIGIRFSHVHLFNQLPVNVYECILAIGIACACVFSGRCLGVR